jgi:hypothetical protein
MFTLRLPQFIPAIIITVKLIRFTPDSKKSTQATHQTSLPDVVVLFSS